MPLIVSQNQSVFIELQTFSQSLGRGCVGFFCCNDWQIYDGKKRDFEEEGVRGFK